MKILLISQWFDPEPTFKGLAFANQLIKQGHQVTVITGFPNYPSGQLYKGYRIKPVQFEDVNGVKVYRVALYPSHDKSAVGRVLNYLSFAFSALVMALVKIWKQDVVYAYHPPLTVGLAAGIAARISGTPLVYDIQDLWPDTLAATGMINNQRALKVVSWFCQLSYKMASSLVVLSPGFKRLLVARGVNEQKITVIPNWCDEPSLASFKQAQTFVPVDAFHIVFAGNMGPAQALEVVLAAAQLLAHQGSRVHFHFVGDGISKIDLQLQVQHQQMSNVTFYPRVAMDEVGAYLTAADALLVHLRDDPLFAITIPSKTQAYMAMGKPVIMAVKGDAADIVNYSGGGVIAQPENAQSLAQVIEHLSAMSSQQLQEMGQKAQDYYQEHLSLAVGVKHFEQEFLRFVAK